MYMLKQVGKGIYKFVANTAKTLKEKTGNVGDVILGELSGTEKEKKALNSDAFKRFKKDFPLEAKRYEENLKKRIKN